MTNKIKNISSKIVSSFWGKLEHIDFDYQFKNGVWKRLTREVYGKSDGAAILLYNKERKTVVLSKQFRMPAYITDPSAGFSIEVCGGAIDDGESPEISILREVREELGYNLSNISFVSKVFLTPGIVKERVYLYLGKYSDLDKVNDGGGLSSEDEEIEVLEIPYSEALFMIDSGEIQDARTIMLLQYLKLKKII